MSLSYWKRANARERVDGGERVILLMQQPTTCAWTNVNRDIPKGRTMAVTFVIFRGRTCGGNTIESLPYVDSSRVGDGRRDTSVTRSQYPKAEPRQTTGNRRTPVTHRILARKLERIGCYTSDSNVTYVTSVSRCALRMVQVAKMEGHGGGVRPLPPKSPKRSPKVAAGEGFYLISTT